MQQDFLGRMMEMRFGMDKELQAEHHKQEELEFEQKKERLENDIQAKRAQERAELAYNVMHDVQAVHQGIDSYLKLVMNSDLTLPPEEWEMMCRELRGKSNLMKEMVDSAQS